jgi:hypothetical protein
MTDLQNRSIVDNEVDFFIDEFNTFDTTDKWDLVQTGAGMAITIAGTTTKYLNINSGVTINSQTIIRSRRTFQAPWRLLCGLTMSQRIANTEFFVELVGVDPTNRVPEADAAGGNANSALNASGWKFDGVSATGSLAYLRGQALPEVPSAALAVGTTAATGTGPNFLPATVFELRHDYETLFHADRAINSGFPTLPRQRRDDLMPEWNKEYKIQIRVRNLGTAPASATDCRVHFMRMLDFTRMLTQSIGTYDALIEKPYGPADLDWQYAAPAGGIITNTAVAVRAAQAAGTRNYVTAMQLRNTNAVATEFVILDGATIIWRGQLPANMAGAEDFNFPTPLRGTAATAINVQCLTTGAAVYANLQGYSAP